MKLKKLLTSIGAFAVTVMLTASVAVSAATSNLRATPGIVIPDLKFTAQSLPDNSALKFTAGLDAGYNLGNAFDGNDTRAYNSATEMNYETSWAWGNPKLTKENVTALKNAGFKTIRLPVSWHNHLTDDKFTISKAWLDRYQTVVDWIVGEGMYVIVNIHHDDDVKYYYPDSKHLESSWEFMSAVWTQLTERFKNYDNHVIFESINEPRLKGTGNEWADTNGNNSAVNNSIKVIMELNQRFVDLVRKTGGKNAERYLMVPSYAARLQNTIYSGFNIPKDTVKDKIIVSVHPYDPTGFVYSDKGGYQYTEKFNYGQSSSTAILENGYKALYEKFTKNGIPVLITEFGSRDKNNLQDRVNYAAYCTALAASYGINTILWDNANFDPKAGESFAILDRKNNTFKYPDIAIALVKYAR
jgi:endoglucanase